MYNGRNKCRHVKTAKGKKKEEETHIMNMVIDMKKVKEGQLDEWRLSEQRMRGNFDVVMNTNPVNDHF